MNSHPSPSGHSFPLRRRIIFLFFLAVFPVERLAAHPRMISFDYPNCVQCHVAPQGRGLLNRYGRDIDMEQSLSHEDYTVRLLGALIDPKFADDS